MTNEVQNSGFEPFHIKRKVLKTVSRTATKEISVDVAAAALLPDAD